MAQKRTRQRQLALWILVNLIIFIACYLNYRLQLKHRYLYRILNAGLCFSRAAAMVINFNLMLVWLPMCKYSLTRLACLAIGTLRHCRHRLAQLNRDQLKQQAEQQVVAVVAAKPLCGLPIGEKTTFSSTQKSLYRKLVTSAAGAWRQLNVWFLVARINSLSSFLTAVDHCKSLHTICATTITIASVVHTVAHLINVINFSKNYDPLMSNLNMAEHKGQNPFQLLISVPGITGSLMIIILILMSLSSVDIIRNSSYDLFQIFHRLSIVFVVLLLLHPSSHVLKEQSNVDRHHPDLCFNRTVRLNSTAVPAFSRERVPTIWQQVDSSRLGRNTVNNLNTTTTTFNESSNRTNDLNNNEGHNKTTINQEDTVLRHENPAAIYIENGTTNVDEQEFGFSRESDKSAHGNGGLCLDSLPLFVAQSSICWFVLGTGLSCYLLDLLLRRWRRSKNSIELLDVRLDCEGNLIELILSNHHKRFKYWLPGQFVYLNCPQIAAYEWHPFTVSSMNNESGQFTLHIKTGGDWTRKLREKLEYMRVSMSFFRQNLHLSAVAHETKQQQQQLCQIKFETSPTTNLQLNAPMLLPSLDCCCDKTGQLQIECTKMVRVKHENELQKYVHDDDDCSDNAVGKGTGREDYANSCNDRNNELYSISYKTSENLRDMKIMLESGLDLYIDGPFHSPFDRLLEQQVSVCVANGVGWTAFSSIFQCITNNLSCTPRASDKSSRKAECWWTKWRNFAVTSRLQDCGKTRAMAKIRRLPDTRLHLMVIVTSIEQMKPFYQLALDYFKKIQDECQIEIENSFNPVREITAFITRCSQEEDAVKEFCRQENLSADYENHSVRVNDLFTIYFGKPKFNAYLGTFSAIYPNRKISVYCCGSSQVKKDVREICQNLNKMDKVCITLQQDKNSRTHYSYHEENF